MVNLHKKLPKAFPNLSADAPFTALSTRHPGRTQFPTMHPHCPCQTHSLLELTSAFTDKSVYGRNTISVADQCQLLQVTAELTTVCDSAFIN